jgi:hypothetical protein
LRKSYQYSDIAMGSGTGGDIRVISQMPQALRVCLCGYPFNPSITGLRGRTATAEMQNFMASLAKAHAFLKKAHAPAPVLDLSVLSKTFAPAQAVADLQVELTELGHAFDDSLLAATLTPPPAVGDNTGVQLVVVEAAEPVKVHPNSREGRSARAALRAAMAAAAEQAAV